MYIIKFYKLFDYVIIDLCIETLLTNNIEFGYHFKHGTTSNIIVLKK